MFTSLIGVILGVIAVSSPHWTNSRDPNAPKFHAGLFDTCSSHFNNDSCDHLVESTDLLTQSQYERIVAIRVLMIVALSFGLVTGICAVLAASQPNKARVQAGSMVLSLTASLIAVVCGLIAVIMVRWKRICI